MRSAKSKKPGEVGLPSAACAPPGGRQLAGRRNRGGGTLGRALLFSGATLLGCNPQAANPAASSPAGEVRAPAAAPISPPAAAPASPAPAAVQLVPAPQTGATVNGRVLLVGKAPPASTLPPGSDPYCARTAIPDEVLQVDAQGGVRNVLVRVVEGAGGPYQPPREPVTLTQTACRYQPRVLGLVRGQPVQVSNGDATLHNVHALLGQSTVLNLVQVDAQAPLIDLRPALLAARTNPLKLRCDVHPWMAAYLWVLDHPFFAVTAADGTFAIAHLAAGEYVLEAWHEQLGTRRAKLTIPPSLAAAAKPARAEFRFTLEKTAPSSPSFPATPTGG